MAAGEVRLGHGVAPANPPAGFSSVYAKADGLIYSRTPAGAESGPFGGGGGGTVGPSNAVYLDAAGNDGTGMRGDAALPFLTFAAALAACQDGDVLRIGPGTFPVPATPAWPAGVQRLAILGSGRGLTSLTTGGAGVFIIEPAFDVTLLVIADLKGRATFAAGARVLSADGTGSAGSFMSEGLILSDVEFTASGAGAFAAVAQFAGLVFIDRYFSFTGETHFRTANVISCIAARFAGVNVFWDDDDADKPGIGRVSCQFDATDFGAGLFIGGQADVSVSASCRTGTLTNGSALAQAPVSLEVPRLAFHGVVNGNIVFDGGASWPDATVPMSIDFTGVVCGGNFAIRKAGVINPANIVQMAGARVTGTLTARQGMDVQVFTDLMGTAGFATPDPTGSITPAQWTGNGFVALPLAAPNVVPFGFRALAAPLSAHATPNALGNPVAVVAMAATDVTVDATLPAGSANITARWI